MFEYTTSRFKNTFWDQSEERGGVRAGGGGGGGVGGVGVGGGWGSTFQ